MATMDSGKGKIMIVDDEESVRDLLSALLKKANYNPIEAEDGMQAIKLLQTDGNMSNVAVILCDLNMPNVDGLGAIEFFKKEAPGIPIIVVSGSSDVTLVSSVLKKGVKDYLTKPIDATKLINAVNKAVRDGKSFDF